MDSQEKREHLQNMFMEAETYRRQLEVAQREMKMLEATAQEIKAAENAVAALKENRVGSNILVPIGAGCFMKAQIADNEKLLVGVGANITIEKNPEETKSFLDGRLEEVIGALEKMQKAAYEINERLLAIEEHSKELVEEMKAAQQAKK